MTREKLYLYIEARLLHKSFNGVFFYFMQVLDNTKNIHYMWTVTYFKVSYGTWIIVYQLEM